MQNSLNRIINEAGGKLNNIKLLIVNGIDINAQNEYGTTSLMMALEKKHTKVIEYLKSKGAK